MDVSVIVPFYRGNKYMEQLFRIMRNNVAGAPNVQMELIIVNDSPDCPVVYETDWIDGFELRIINNLKNSGIHRSRVNGIRAAGGEYIQLLDQDDWLENDAIFSQLTVLGKNDVVVANGYSDSGIEKIPLYTSVWQQRMVLEEKYYYSIGNMISSPGQAIIRKSVFPEKWLDKYIENNGSDDLLLWFLLFKSSCKWVINPAKLYTHVYTGVNLSLDFEKMKKSSDEVVDFLKEQDLVSKAQERVFHRRFKMREMYDGKGKIKKIEAILLYPDLALDLVRKKIYGLM